MPSRLSRASTRRSVAGRLRGRVCASIVALAVVPLAARAEKPRQMTSSLSWVRLAGAEECVGTQDLARDVEQRLGRSVFVSAAHADVSVEGHVEPRADGPGWQAAITVRDAKGALLGTRELARRDSSCAEMREPIALVIAVMIDPDATVSPGPREAPPSRPAILLAEGPVVGAAPSLPRGAPWRFDAGASIIGGAGLLPNPGIGVSGGGLLEPPHLPALLGFGAIWFDNSASTAGPGVETFSLAFLGGGICPLTTHGDRIHGYLCGVGHLGLLKSRGSGFEVPLSDGQRVFLAGALEGRLTLRVFGPLTARAGLSLVVPIVRHAFTYRQPSGAEVETFRMAPVAATADLGFGVVLP